MHTKTTQEQVKELKAALKKHRMWEAEYFCHRPPRAWHTGTTELITYNIDARTWSSPLGRYPTAAEAVSAIEQHYRELVHA